MLSLHLCDQEVRLYPQRALYLPFADALLIADAHFGKSQTFRAHGIPVPSGTTADNLARLDALILACQPRQVIFLGDFLHAKPGRQPGLWTQLQAWRQRHAHLHLILVRGNHDRHAGDPPTELDIQCVEEPFTLGSFALCHTPQEHQAGYTLAGHIHPAIRLRGRVDSVRLPCFWFGQRIGVLPAFGAFTGGYVVQCAPQDKVVGIVDGHLLVLPTTSSSEEASFISRPPVLV